MVKAKARGDLYASSYTIGPAISRGLYFTRILTLFPIRLRWEESHRTKYDLCRKQFNIEAFWHTLLAC